MKKSLFSALIACVALVFVGCEPPVTVDYTVTLSETSLNMGLEETKKLNAVVNPATTAYAVAWTSSNTDVATVTQAGIVTSVGLGTATITATLNVPEGDETVGTVTPATCEVVVTADAAYDNFALGGYALFGLGDFIPGTEATLELSIGEVKCQLVMGTYYAWDEDIVMVGNSLSGAGRIMELSVPTYVITEGAYAGYYIGSDILVDTVAEGEYLPYTGQAGQLLDVQMYGDAWKAIWASYEAETQEEFNEKIQAAYEIYFASQTGAYMFHIDLSDGSQSYNLGNVSYAYITEETNADGDEELFYDLKLEWYDHVNPGRYYGLLYTTVEEDGVEYLDQLIEPYDMRVINKQYQKLPEAAAAKAKTADLKIKKPMKLNLEQERMLKDMHKMYKK